jgi:hypothetical protein
VDLPAPLDPTMANSSLGSHRQFVTFFEYQKKTGRILFAVGLGSIKIFFFLILSQESMRRDSFFQTMLE